LAIEAEEFIYNIYNLWENSKSANFIFPGLKISWRFYAVCWERCYPSFRQFMSAL